MKRRTLSKISYIPDTEEACCLAQSISYANSDFFCEVRRQIYTSLGFLYHTLEGLNFWFLGPSLQGPSFLYDITF